MSYYFQDLNRRYQQDSLDLVITDDVRALESNIDNILRCPVGSFMFNRNFGSRLKHFLFEPMNDRTAMSIKIYLIEAVGAWEPRIFVDMQNTYVVPDYDGGISGMPGYFVRIVYQIRSTQQIGEYVRLLPTQVGA